MTEPRPSPTPPDPLPWRAVTAAGLLAAVWLLDPNVTPGSRYPDVNYYVWPYVLLALSVGLGLSAARSGRIFDRVVGVAVLVAGGGLVAYIAWSHLRLINR